ncbi:MAG: diacylglycerol kinase [Porticoccaceae bacterium]|jgi:diacylglycerol kinase (ATP)
MNSVKGLLKRRLVGALTYSVKGLKACYIHEEAFRLEVALSVVLIPLGLWLGSDGVERALLVGSVMLILIVELLNSAVEAAIDRIGLEHAELSGRAKDLGSAAVLLSVTLLVLVWGLLLF